MKLGKKNYLRTFMDQIQIISDTEGKSPDILEEPNFLKVAFSLQSLACSY